MCPALCRIPGFLTHSQVALAKWDATLIRHFDYPSNEYLSSGSGFIRLCLVLPGLCSTSKYLIMTGFWLDLD